MQLVELIKMCNEKIDTCKAPFEPTVTILIKGKWGVKPYRSLFGVKGEIVTDTVEKGCLMCVFPAQELLNAVVKQLPRVTL